MSHVRMLSALCSSKILTILAAVLTILTVVSPVSAEEGLASWYGQPFHGRPMYSGKIFDMYNPTTTASNQFPIGTWLKVTNPANGRSVVVQVLDRGGFKWALDLSYAAFKALDDPTKMMLRVRYEVVDGPEAADSEQPVAAPAAASPTAPPPSTPSATSPTPPAKPASTTPLTSASAPVVVENVPADYVVQRGDTLLSIARRFGLDAATISAVNDLADVNRLAIGQHLKLKTQSAGNAAPSSRGAASAPTAKVDVHVVAPGDTMWAIATKFGTTPKRLSEINGLSDEDLIVVGQSLRLGSPTPSVPPKPAAASPADKGRHTVEAGDTLFGIALRNGISVSALATANSIDESDLLQIGQTLILP